MHRRPYNLLVFDDDEVALEQVLALLLQRDYVFNTAKNIEQARWWLSLRPIDLLITAAGVRGAGLQFIASARSQLPDLVSILIATEADQQLEMAAWRYNARLIVRPYDPPIVLMVVAEALASIRRRQRWPRKRVYSTLPVKVSGTAATLLDVSYGGLGFAFEGEGYTLPSPMTIEYSAPPLTVTAELVWSSRSSDGVRCVCGAAIVGDAPPPEWRRFVDHLPHEI